MEPRVGLTTVYRPSSHLSAPPLPANASVGKRWKFRRNLVIFIANRNGVSQRLLADVFDLPRSRIASIIAQFRPYLDPAANAQ